jgi:hypothetical protein
MSSEHSGFIWDIKQPTREGYVACLVITPKCRDGTHSADTEAKVERNLGRSTALKIASELLAACNVPADLVERIKALNGGK